MDFLLGLIRFGHRALNILIYVLLIVSRFHSETAGRSPELFLALDGDSSLRQINFLIIECLLLLFRDNQLGLDTVHSFPE